MLVSVTVIPSTSRMRRRVSSKAGRLATSSSATTSQRPGSVAGPGKRLSRLTGARAAGGLGAGLVGFLGAELRPGAEVVLEAVDFRQALQGADWVVTGEGRLDGDDAEIRGKAEDEGLQAPQGGGRNHDRLRNPGPAGPPRPPRSQCDAHEKQVWQAEPHRAQ